MMYVILGCGSVGANLAHILKGKGNKVMIIDKDPTRVEALREQGLEAMVGDMREIDRLEFDIEATIAFLILTTQIDVTIDTIETIHELAPSAYIIARANDLAAKNVLTNLELDYVIEVPEEIANSVLRRLEIFESKRAANNLVQTLRDAEPDGVGIFVHNNPDPDALAAAWALQHICDEYEVKSQIYHGGKVEHQENRAFVNVLGIKLHRLDDDAAVEQILESVGKVALVDSNTPGANNVLPEDLIPNLIVDHHSTDKRIVGPEFVDVKEGMGAASTIMTRYLQQLVIKVDKKLASALLYGIRTDTNGFTRNTSPTDLTIAAYLSPLADHELLNMFESPPMSSETLDIMGRAIMHRESYGSYLFSCVGTSIERDALPQAADFLLKLEGISTTFVFGIVDTTIQISARSNDMRVHLGDMLRAAFGSVGSAGGHARYAGGQIPLGILGSADDKKTLVELAKNAVTKNLLNVIGIDVESNGRSNKKPNGNGNGNGA